MKVSGIGKITNCSTVRKASPPNGGVNRSHPAGPQVIWKTAKKHPLWNKAHARYNRSSSGGGGWTVYRELPETWKIRYEAGFNIKTMGFKHTGVFPGKPSVGFHHGYDSVAGRPVSVLNLFAYGPPPRPAWQTAPLCMSTRRRHGRVGQENALACGVSGRKSAGLSMIA